MADREYPYSTGEQLYALVGVTAVALEAGTGLQSDIYSLTDAAMVSAGIESGDYTVRVKLGTVAAASADDTTIFAEWITWSGTELSLSLGTIAEVVRAELDTNSTQLEAILEDTGTTISAAVTEASQNTNVSSINNKTVTGEGIASNPFRAA